MLYLFLCYRADSRFVSSQWEIALLCNNISHWLATNPESALFYVSCNVIFRVAHVINGIWFDMYGGNRNIEYSCHIQSNPASDCIERKWYMDWNAELFHAHRRIILVFIFCCDQAALRTLLSMCLSVRPSVCPSVCHTIFTMFSSSYHPEIFRSNYHWPTWCPCKRSRSEVKGQGHRGHDPI